MSDFRENDCAVETEVGKTDKPAIAPTEREMIYTILIHDLKNSFMSILGLSDLLAGDALNLSREEIFVFSSNINKAAHKVNSSLIRMLEWSGVYTGKIKNEPWDANVYRTIDDACEVLEPLAKLKEIKIQNFCDPDNTAIMDWNVISIILRNLLANAIKYSPRGKNIVVSASISDDEFVLDVDDFGVGMSASQIEKLFVPDKNNKTRGTENEIGTGLGLIMCKELVEKAGGIISINSSENSGTTVRIIMPLN